MEEGRMAVMVRLIGNKKHAKKRVEVEVVEG